MIRFARRQRIAGMRATLIAPLLLPVLLVLLITNPQASYSFQHVVYRIGNNNPPGRPCGWVAPSLVVSSSRAKQHASSSTSLNMFMGSDGGILGIGAPELFTILLVGYFVLGPSDLYKLTKEIGKFITNARTLSTDLTTTFESNMESQLQLEELRKAQRELTDAFSFRRSINVDEDEEAFSTTVKTPRAADVGPQDETAAAADTPKKKKKKIRRRKKKQPAAEEPANGNVPDLDMSDAMAPEQPVTATSREKELTEEEVKAIEEEFEKYTSVEPHSEWYEDSGLPKVPAPIAEQSPAEAAAQQTRFQQQLTGDWNEQVLANEEKLSPLSKVMEMLALLEQEKVDSDKLLQEEFEKRKQVGEDYYQKQRRVLEDAAAEVQQSAYVTLDSTDKSDK